MNLEVLTRYTPQRQQDINLVRLYLQVFTLSDMAVDRHNICSYHHAGERRPDQRIETTTWPRQEAITKSQQRLWTKYLSSTHLRYSTKWRSPVIDDIPLPTPILPTEHTTLISYLATLPRWYQRLLSHYYEQEATDLEVWRVFRSKQKITLSTDGSLLPTAGTFVWKMTTSTNTTLFLGSGPIDGPLELGSSTRSELGGFTGPLLLVTIIARFWGLRHKCKFRWLVDSKIALNKVVFVPRHDYRPTKQPDNHDYLSVIRELFNKLGRPVKAQWIRSHQDAKKDYKDLPPDAQHNVDADKLATYFHKRPRSTPSRTTAHLSTSKVSISINKVRYLGNIDAHLRFHINGSYLRTYLQDKHHHMMHGITPPGIESIFLLSDVISNVSRHTR